jgi:uncharacterized protein YndB with AHSA1/START domain
MTEQTAPSTLTKTVVVDAPRDHAFEVFTKRFDTWWPREHHLRDADMAEAVLEPREGGRWYERSVDGGECDWGRVLVWEPPERLVVTWQITAAWSYDPDFVTEVEVRFVSEADDRTRVELEHRHLDRFGDKEDEMRRTFASPGGWSGLLERFAREAAS